jgi:hypothetical protein
MPPPSVRCSVCNYDVLKAQTVCIGADANGTIRCCKKHPEAAKADAWRKEQDEERQQKERERQHRAKEQSLYAGGTVAGTTAICWCCMEPGIYINEFWLMMLEENIKSRMEQRPATELFDGTLAKRVKKRLEDMKKVVLVRFTDLTAEQMTPLWQSKMPKMFKDLLPVTRGAILCLKCAAAAGLRYEPPNPTMEQLQASAVWLQFSGLEQAIEEKIARNN